MKAAVIVPPIEDFYFTNHRFAVMGALKASEIIEEAGISTVLINLPLIEKKQIKIPSYLNYLKPHIIEGETGSCSFFTAFRRYGPDTADCCRIIHKEKPDYVFFSLFAYCYAEPAAELAAALKKEEPSLMLIAGGAGVSVYPEYFTPFFDAVLTGEGEIVLRDFIKRMKKTGRIKQKGFAKPDCISCSSAVSPDTAHCSDNTFNTVKKRKEDLYQKERSIKKIKAAGSNSENKSLNYEKNKSLPSGKIIDTGRHTEEGDFSLSVNTAHSDRHTVYISALLSRGCNKRCRFCSNFITHGRTFRKTSIRLIKQELDRKKNFSEFIKGKNTL